MNLNMGAMALGVISLVSLTSQECNDKDWDDIQDKDDNCVQQYNPQQLDSDADGRGDACDTDTPDFGAHLAECYITNYDELRGIGWTDVLLVIGEDAGVGTYGVFYWPPGEYPEFGYTPFNGRDFWLMALGGAGSTLQTATYVEATATEIGSDGTILRMSGTYEMMSCENPGCQYPDDPEFWDAFNDGIWDAVAGSGDECVVPD